MNGQRIHITVDLEDLIRREVADLKNLPLLGATSEDIYQYQRGYLRALEWVLQQAHAELDE